MYVNRSEPLLNCPPLFYHSVCRAVQGSDAEVLLQHEERKVRNVLLLGMRGQRKQLGKPGRMRGEVQEAGERLVSDSLTN